MTDIYYAVATDDPREHIADVGVAWTLCGQSVIIPILHLGHLDECIVCAVMERDRE